MRIEIDEQWGVPRVTDKAEIRQRAQQLFGEQASQTFRHVVSQILRKDRYRKSVSRELSWAILDAAIRLAQEGKAFQDRDQRQKLKEEDQRIDELDQLWVMD